MKTADQESDQSKQLNFYRQRLNKSPVNRSNSNYFTNDYKNAQIISKLQINFPKMKICESRRDITEDSFEYQTDNRLAFGNPKLSPKQNIQKDITVSNKPSAEEYGTKRQRSPVRFNEYSYQETTKEDYSQNNTSSYHDFFKVPIQLNNGQNGSYNALAATNKEIQSKYDNKNINPFSSQARNQTKAHMIEEKTQPQYAFQPMRYSSKYEPISPISKDNKIDQSPKQKGQMSLSRLLSDLQKRSEKLYEIYGQNNQDYQRCLDTIQQNQKSSLVKHSSYERKLTPEKSGHKFIKEEEDYRFNQKDSIKFKQQYDFLSDKKVSRQKINSYNYEIRSEWKTQPEQRNTFQNKIFTPIKQKLPINFERNYGSADKITPYNFESTPTANNIQTNKSRQNLTSQKKKKVMFYREQNENLTQNFDEQKIRTFVNHMLKFFNRFMINMLRSKFYYETGVLSTQSNIHAPSGKNNVPEVTQGEKSSKDAQQTSFFQEYFQQKRNNTENQIVYGVIEAVPFDKTPNMKKSKSPEDYLTPYALLPIEEQLQSSYGQSMTKSQQKKPLPIVYREENYGTANSILKKNRDETDSHFNEFMNTNQSRKVEQLLIQSINKNIFQFTAPNDHKFEQTRKQLKINLPRFSKGLEKVQEIMKYKVLTMLRYSYLVLKFVNTNFSERNGISSLKVSSVSKQSKQTGSKYIQNQYIQNLAGSSESQKRSQPIENFSKASPTRKNQQMMVTESSRGAYLNKQPSHQPKNILDQYYKKSSPNSQTNQYASIIEEPKPSSPKLRVQSFQSNEASKEEMRRSRFNPALTKQPLLQLQPQEPLRQSSNTSAQSPITFPQAQKLPPPIRQSQFLPQSLYQTPRPTLQQEYYVSRHNYQQPTQEQINLNLRPRTSRALSSQSSKVSNFNNDLPINPSRISKEALMSGNVRQQQLPVYSQSSTGGMLRGNNDLMQQQQQIQYQLQGQQMRQSNMMMVRQSQMTPKESMMHGSSLSVANRLSSMFSNQPLTPNNQQQTPYPPPSCIPFNINTAIRPLQPQQKHLDYYNKNGKISRSFSENDFKNYHCQAQTMMPVNNPLRQSNNHVAPVNTQGVMRSSNVNQSRSRMGTMGQSTMDERDPLRRSSIDQLQPLLSNNPTSMKNSAMIMRNSHMKASNVIQRDEYALQQNNPHTMPPSQFQQPFQPHTLNPMNQQPMPQTNPPTVRPLLNPSMQKKRSYSLGSFLNGPSLIHNLNFISNTPSMLKELQGKPFIQYKHYNQNVVASQQNQPYLNGSRGGVQESQVSMQQPITTQQGLYMDQVNQVNQFNQVNQVNQFNQFNQMRGRQVMQGQVLQQNRARVSKSMDQFVLRPTSFSGYNPSQSIAGLQQQTLSSNNMLQPNLAMRQNPTTQPFVAPITPRKDYTTSPNKQVSSPSNYLSTQNTSPTSPNKFLPTHPTNTRKQVQVDSEYHLLKNTLANNIENVRNLRSLNGNRNVGTSGERSNELMKATNESFGKGSRVKYEEQNLMGNNQMTYKTHDPKQSYASPPSHKQSPTNFKQLQQPTTITKTTSPSYQSPQQATKPPPNPSISNSNKIPGLTKSPPNQSIKSSHVNNATQQLGAPQLPKPRSPEVLIKGKSPSVIKGKSPISNVKLKEVRLGNYGQD